MARDHNLPSIFARVHPWRHTPHWAVLLSGGLMLVMAWALPIEDVAAAASIMFLLLFIQVNLAVMAYRRKMPEVERWFRVPWFPLIPIIAIVCNTLLALYLFTFSPIAWYFAIGWIFIGALAYYAHFSKIEAMEKPKEIMLEEVLVSRDYSIVVPVATHGQARILGKIGAILARDNEGEVLALNVVIQQGKELDVPVHTVLRLGRNVSEAIRKTVDENAADLLLLGWPGYTQTSGRIFGSISDPIIDNPPTDIALVRYRAWRPLRSILVPVAGGPNTHRAIKLAVSMARGGAEKDVDVTLLHVIPSGANRRGKVRADQVLRDACEAVDYERVDCQSVPGTDVAKTILDCAKGKLNGQAYDLIVTGATNEPLLKNLLLGNITERIAREADVTVIVVKRRSSPLHSFLRQTVLEPSSNNIKK
jgi:APA family basic amino acid/polyamine antiporter